MRYNELLDKHIEDLCEELEVTREVTPGRGRARVEERWIKHPPIGADEMAYFVALHELGHIVIGLVNPRLEREALAWRWALDMAMMHPHYTTRQRICACLVRYQYRAKENGWRLPEPDSEFWNLLQWWREDGKEDSIGL